MIILLSPSKTINFKPVADTVAPSEPQFLERSQELVTTVNTLGDQLAKVFGVSEAIAQQNTEQFRAWSAHAAPDDSCPAAWAYRGETFAGLSVEKLNAEAQKFAQDHLFIVSGLYGLLRPMDRIMPYRLEMSTKLVGEWGKNLYEFWGATLANHIAQQKPSFILNCASDEYFKAIKKHLSDEIRVVTPKFLHEGKSKMAFAKYSRGLMARWAVENSIHTPQEVLEFTAEGYAYDAASNPTEPIFNAPKNFSLKGRWTKL